ncbi:MAG: hypothetical protein M1491_04365, partial [Deltaproteobacteria bacterium]|nr:hypothetical protein [Deltaproteobacteria bacterium]
MRTASASYRRTATWGQAGHGEWRKGRTDMLKDRIEALKALFRDSDERVRQAASSAIERLSLKADIGKFGEALASDDVLVRSRAVFGLSGIDDQRSLEYLAMA